MGNRTPPPGYGAAKAVGAISNIARHIGESLRRFLGEYEIGRMEIFILKISETPLFRKRKQTLRVLREFSAFSAFKSYRVGYLMTPLPMLISFDAEAEALHAAQTLLLAVSVTLTVYLPRGS